MSTLTVEQAVTSFVSEEFSRQLADVVDRLARERVARTQSEQALRQAQMEAAELREDNDALRARVVELEGAPDGSGSETLAEHLAGVPSFD